MFPDIRNTFPDVAHGGAILYGALGAAAAPLPEMTISEHADAHRKIGAESGSPYPGDWFTDRVPYLREPMDCLHPDHPARRVVLRGSAQTGKSEIGVNWFCHIVDVAPGTMLIVLPSLEEASKYNKVKLQPTIDASEKIRHKVRPENSRDEHASTTSFKRFAGGFAQVVTASSSKGLQMVSIRNLLLEEVSEYPLDTDGRGSPIDQARRGLKAYSDRAKEFAVSTPGIEGECQITFMFESGDMRFLYVPCPHCGTYQVLVFDQFAEPSVSNPNVGYECLGTRCGVLIEHFTKKEMVAQGKWIPTWVTEGAEPVPPVIAAEEIGKFECAPCEGRCMGREPSYHIWSAYSPFENWNDIWNRRREAEGKPLKLKTFYQQDLGLPFDPASDAPDWQKLLAARKDWAKGVIPWPGCVLTGFIDVQGDRLEWGLWVWGPKVQGWIVDAGIIPIAPDQPECWEAVDELLMRSWPTSGGAMLRPDAWGIDTGGNHTTHVYNFCAGRALMIYACKGSSDRGAPPLGTPKMQDVKDEFKRPIAKVPLYQVGNFKLKSDIYQGLRYLVEGPDSTGDYKAGTIHLPDWVDEAYAKQLTAEVLVNPQAEAKGKAKIAALMKPGDKREWRQKLHQPNEAFDIVVGARALAWHLQIDTLSDEQWNALAAERGQAPAGEPDLFTPPPVAPVEPEAAAAATTDQAQAERARRLALLMNGRS